jgi:hypothetical protein
MGGRSKQRTELLPDNFAWLKDVSDDRLDRYGKAGQARYLAGKEDPKRATGVFDAVWDNAAIEYRIRNGVDPDWSPNKTPLPSYHKTSGVPKLQDLMVSATAKWDGDHYVIAESKSASKSDAPVYKTSKRGYAASLNGLNRQQIVSIKSGLDSQIATLKQSKDSDKHVKLKRLRRAYAATDKAIKSMD